MKKISIAISYIFYSSVEVELSFQAIKYFLPVQVSLTVAYEIGHITVILQNGRSSQTRLP